MALTDPTKQKMNGVIEHLKDELKNIRTGRPNPAMLDGVVVDIHETPMKIKQLAIVTTPENQLLITPFDPKNTGAIAKAIQAANLGVQPIADGKTVRVKIPTMDQNVRKEMVKLCHKKKEEAKVGIRNIRRDANDFARKQKTNGDIAEDLLKKLEKEIQELTDKFCKEADDLAQKKEQEIMTV